VSARSLERFDSTLVSFGTRHTLSSQDDPKRGIGAARDWIKASSTRSPRRRRPDDRPSSTASSSRCRRGPGADRDHQRVATLKGTDPTAADRVYVVGGHYDSRVTDVLNATDDAPGANDDGSGTSARSSSRA
jgi:hypothetical protein